MDIPNGLSKVGVKEELIEKMSIDAMKSGNIAVNPRVTAIEDIIRMYYEEMLRDFVN